MNSHLDKLKPIYGGVLLKRNEVGERLYYGNMRPDEFRTLFTVYDPRDRTLPSLGMFITTRLTYLLLMDGLAGWAQRIAGRMTENLQVRDWLSAALYPVKHYTHEVAEETMLASPQVRRVLIAGTLKEFGLAATHGWVQQAAATTLIQDDRNVVAEIILQHLQEAGLAEVRAFMGANRQYDHTELLGVLGDWRDACADVASRRAPQLFLYHGHKLGVTEEVLSAIYQWIIHGRYHFTAEQKHQLVDAPWLSSGVQAYLREQWSLPE